MRLALALLLFASALQAQYGQGVLISQQHTKTATLYTIKNDRASPLEAFVGEVRYYYRRDPPPVEFIVKDYVASNGRDPALQPDESFTFPPLPPDDARVTAYLHVCAAVFRNGLVFGRKECLDKIFEPRRALLASARQALEVLEPTTQQTITRQQLLQRLSEVKNPQPATLALRQSIQYTTDDNFGLIVRDALEQLKAKVELLSNSRPALD